MSKTNNKSAGIPAPQAAAVQPPAVTAAPAEAALQPPSLPTGGAAPSGGGAGNGSGNTAAGGSVNGSGLPGFVPGKLGKSPSTKFRAELEQIESALEDQIPAGTLIPLGQQSVTVEDILGVLQPTSDLYSTYDSLVAQVKTTRANLASAIPATEQYVKSLKVALTNLLGKGNPVLAAFGIGKKKPASSQTKYVASQKASQTRALRGTKGTRQKKAVKFQGALQAQAVTPPGASGQGGTPAPATANGSSTAASGSSPAGGNTGTPTGK